VVTVKASNLSKRYSRILFRDMSFCVTTGQSLAIAGPNGSGKSTLLKIIAGVMTPDSGNVAYWYNDNPVDTAYIRNYIGFAAPYINVYKHLTALENITFAIGTVDDDAVQLLDVLGLSPHSNTMLMFYSTGMIQRVKLALAFLKKASVLCLDEPGSNLDEQGKRVLFSLLEKVQPTTAIFIATNDFHELNFCKRSIVLD